MQKTQQIVLLSK